MAGERITAAAPAPRSRRAPRPLSRRDVLRVTAAGGLLPLLALAGCDIRLEDDAPALPLLQRKSVPDEATIVAAVRLTASLGQLAGRVPQPSAVVTALAGLHRTQADVLRGRLTAQGVPLHVIDDDPPPSPTSGTPTTGPTPTAAVSAPPPASATDLGAAEVAATTSLLGALPPVTPANRPVLASVAAACAIAAEELGAATTWPTSDPLPGAAALPLLAATRSAAYAFPVIAAQTTGDRRARALATTGQLQARAADLTVLAGAAAPPAPLGYVLPFPVTDADSADRLATQVLTTLVAGGLEPLDAVPAGSTGVVPLVRLLAGAASIARAWGVGTGPFPALVYP